MMPVWAVLRRLGREGHSLASPEPPDGDLRLTRTCGGAGEAVSRSQDCVRALRANLSRIPALRPDSSAGGRPGQEGQSLVMGALTIFAVLALAALLVDGSMAFVMRRKVQNAADAAAFAGARQLSLGASDAVIRSTINEYAVARNGASSFSASYLPGNATVGGGSVPSGSSGVQVTGRAPSPAYFASAAGLQAITVGATAKASFGGVSQPGPSLQPLARKCTGQTLEECGFVGGQSYDIWQGQDPGNFGWLTWAGINNDPELIQELTPGNAANYIDPHHICKVMKIGCWVQGRTGVKGSSGVKNALDWWIAHPSTPMIIIIYDTSEKNGSNANYLIKGFAAFVVQSYDLDKGRITGKFVRYIVAAPVTNTGDQYGVTAVHFTP